MISDIFLVNFITNPRLRKMAFFLANVDGKKILILKSRSLVTCGEGVRHPTTPVQRQSFVLIKP